jgi:hypothetical protein
MLGFVAESAEFSQGKFIFHGIRVDFAPSETPHISLLGGEISKELVDPLQEVPLVPQSPQVQILDESTELEYEKQNSEELEDEKTDIDDMDEINYDMNYEDDGGLMSMDLSE